MIGTPAIRNLIRENKIAQMYSAIQTGRQIGMQTLDQNLQELVKRNIISSAEARGKAANKDNFAAIEGNLSMEREQATKFMYDLLRALVAKKGSDLFITAGFPPAMKIDGKMTPVSQQALTAAAHRDARARGDERQAGGRVRGDEGVQLRHQPRRHRPLPRQLLRAAGRVGMVLRAITTTIPNFDDLKLPPVLKDVAMTKRGLVIFVGGTGSGKSTSLAAMIGYRNENSHGHIITIEDPVEYVHPHKNCLITQREVGVDTDSWEAALKNTLRQAPDVILIGEIRDREMMEHAIAFAETGHLCLGTLHANNSNQALDRIINFFPEERRQQLLMDLSLNLKAVISQRLIPLRKARAAPRRSRCCSTRR